MNIMLFRKPPSYSHLKETFITSYDNLADHTRLSVLFTTSYTLPQYLCYCCRETFPSCYLTTKNFIETEKEKPIIIEKLFCLDAEI